MAAKRAARPDGDAEKGGQVESIASVALVVLLVAGARYLALITMRR